jgi:hypothetical protein
MPLLDHFHAPLSEQDFWESFHSVWVVAIMERLNSGLLPPGFVARSGIHFGQIEVDVAAIERMGEAKSAEPSPQPWAPAAATLTVPATFPDTLEVRIYSSRSLLRLVGAVELVSPRNKDRADARRTFAAKCVSYLMDGVGLIVVDTVTGRNANLHNEIMALLGQDGPALLPLASLYAVAYRPSDPIESATGKIDMWPARLEVGAALPELPLALKESWTVPVDLEATYTEARRRSLL